MSLFPPAAGAAVFSPCARYRYTLRRTWGEGPVVCWVMFNPSTADAELDDPTIRRCIGFSKAWGAGGLVVVNVLAYRTPYPTELSGLEDPVGPLNDEVILRETEGRRIIAAWGSSVERYAPGRIAAVLKLLEGRAVECLKLSADGHPWHPLYIKGDTKPVPFSPSRK